MIDMIAIVSMNTAVGRSFFLADQLMIVIGNRNTATYNRFNNNV